MTRRFMSSFGTRTPASFCSHVSSDIVFLLPACVRGVPVRSLRVL